MIREIRRESEHAEVARLMRRSFGTVARELGLTEESAPTNPAFVTVERLRAFLKRGAKLFGLFDQGEIIGCVAIEPSEDAAPGGTAAAVAGAAGAEGVYYLERLAVAPERRHCGHGSALLAYAVDRIQKAGGRVVSIALIDDNRVLKEWYREKGFVETGRRRFDHLPFEVCFMSRKLAAGKMPRRRRSSASPRERGAEN